MRHEKFSRNYKFNESTSLQVNTSIIDVYKCDHWPVFNYNFKTCSFLKRGLGEAEKP